MQWISGGNEAAKLQRSIGMRAIKAGRYSHIKASGKQTAAQAQPLL